jgi:hypothetical protein
VLFLLVDRKLTTGTIRRPPAAGRRYCRNRATP